MKGVGKTLIFHNNLRDHLTMTNLFFSLHRSLYPQGSPEEWLPNGLISTLCMPSHFFITRWDPDGAVVGASVRTFGILRRAQLYCLGLAWTSSKQEEQNSAGTKL